MSRGSQQDRQQRAERVGQVFEEGVDESVLAAGLGAGGGLDVGVRGVGGVLHLGQVADLLVDTGDGTADDNLVAVTGLGHRAQDAGDRLDSGLVDDGGVAELEA